MKHIKGLSDEQLEAALSTASAEHQKLCDQMNAIQKKALTACRGREKLQEEKDKRSIAQLDTKHPERFTPEQWEYVLWCDFSETTARYNLANKVAESLDIRFSGFSQATSQRVPQVRLYRDDVTSHKNTLNALNLILPNVKPVEIRHQDGSLSAKYIGIFESSLSEHGSYFAVVNEVNNVFWLMKSSYGRTQVLEKCNSLQGLISYIQKNHYYRVNKGEY